jgi:hypothetical protein
MTRTMIAALVAVAALAICPTAGAKTIHVTPTGSASPGCGTTVAPCEFRWAVQTQAAENDTVVVHSGVYSSGGGHAITDNINVIGAPGEPRPLIKAAVGSVLQVHPATPSEIAKTIRGIAFEGGSRALVLDRAGNYVLENVELRSRDQGSVALLLVNSGATIRNSILHGRGVDAVGLRADAVAPTTEEPVAVEGSTIVGEGAGLIAVTRGACTNSVLLAPDLEVYMSNTIARGGTWDVYAQPQCGNGPAPGRIAFLFELVNWQTFGDSLGNWDLVHVNDQREPPLFSGPGLRQQPASPTVNAGSAALVTGETDVDGEPRTMGSAPDIGADEYREAKGPGPTPKPVPPVLSGLAASGRWISYRLSEDATVSFKLARRAKGRRVRGRCVVTKRPGRPCVSWVRLPLLITDRGERGPNRLRLGRRLRPGVYRITATPVDLDGTRGSPVRRELKVRRASRTAVDGHDREERHARID